MHALERYVRATGLGEKLLELVRMRASQMNGCAYCLDMHSKDARAAGEIEQRRSDSTYLMAVPVAQAFEA
jgi:AhpD family alkylhydroperoxidase